MKTKSFGFRKILLTAAIMVAAMFALAGCGEATIPDGSTGIVVRDGVADDNYLQPGRHDGVLDHRTSVTVIDNKLQNHDVNEKFEAQSKDDVIINVEGCGFGYRVGAGDKSVWLVKNVSDLDDMVPDSLVIDALKDALLEVEAQNATKRIYVAPRFKEILQQRLDEHFGYHKGDDVTLVAVQSVWIGNLSPEHDYDVELSRSTILAKRAENDQKEAELNRKKAKAEADFNLEQAKAQAEYELEKAKSELEIAKINAEKQAVELQEKTKYYTPEVLTHDMIEMFREKWDGHLEENSPLGTWLMKVLSGGVSLSVGE